MEPDYSKPSTSKEPEVSTNCAYSCKEISNSSLKIVEKLMDCEIRTKLFGRNGKNISYIYLFLHML